MDETQLETLLNRLRQQDPAGIPPEPGAVWRGVTHARRRAARRRDAAWWSSGIAAATLIGAGLGRFTAPSPAAPPGSMAQIVSSGRSSPEEMQLGALAESSASLFTAVVQHEPMASDSTWRVSVSTMLWTTRQLLGTPELDVSRQAILQDLELVLVQLLGVSPGSDPLELDLAREAIQLRDMVPRLGALRSTAESPARSRGEAT